MNPEDLKALTEKHNSGTATREEEVQLLIASGMGKTEAEFAVAIERGEISGDLEMEAP